MIFSYLGLGSNLGNRNKYLISAISFLEKDENISIVKKSSIAETKPVDFLNQPDFLNQIVLIETSYSPYLLLDAVKDIEKKVGRILGLRKGPREIDIDILLYDNVVLADKKLIIPHPEIKNRMFILRHLVEINFDIEEPESGLKYARLL